MVVDHWSSLLARTTGGPWNFPPSWFIPEGKTTTYRIDHGLPMVCSMVLVYLGCLHSVNHDLPMVHFTVMVSIDKRVETQFHSCGSHSQSSPSWKSPSFAFSSPFVPCFIEILSRSYDLWQRSSILSTELIPATLFKLLAMILTLANFQHQGSIFLAKFWFPMSFFELQWSFSLISRSLAPIFSQKPWFSAALSSSCILRWHQTTNIFFSQHNSFPNILSTQPRSN